MTNRQKFLWVNYLALVFSIPAFTILPFAIKARQVTEETECALIISKNTTVQEFQDSVFCFSNNSVITFILSNLIILGFSTVIIGNPLLYFLIKNSGPKKTKVVVEDKQD